MDVKLQRKLLQTVAHIVAPAAGCSNVSNVLPGTIMIILITITACQARATLRPNNGIHCMSAARAAGPLSSCKYLAKTKTASESMRKQEQVFAHTHARPRRELVYQRARRNRVQMKIYLCMRYARRESAEANLIANWLPAVVSCATLCVSPKHTRSQQNYHATL